MTIYIERGSRSAHVCPWLHFASILQTKAESIPSHSGFDRHNCVIGVARIYLTRRSPRPSRLGHSGGGRGRDPLCCDTGVPSLQVPTEAREAVDGDTADTDPLRGQRGRPRILTRRRVEPFPS